MGGRTEALDVEHEKWIALHAIWSSRCGSWTVNIKMWADTFNTRLSSELQAVLLPRCLFLQQRDRSPDTTKHLRYSTKMTLKCNSGLHEKTGCCAFPCTRR